MIADDASARKFLRALFAASIDAVRPDIAVRAHLPTPPKGRVVVVGAGKATAAMAAAVDAAWPDVDVSGVIVTRYGHAVPAGRIRVIEASHPVPDEASVDAAKQILHAVRGLTADDMVLALISGGGSALLCMPAGSMTLAEKQDINRQLLSCGATIGEMNVVRRALSGIKGGRLAAAAGPARVVTLLISDVPGDNPADIASGPTVDNPDTPERVHEIIARYGLELPPSARAALADYVPVRLAARPDTRIIASPFTALRAAAEFARENGITPVILGDAIEGEAAQMGIVMGGIARAAKTIGHPVAPPAVLLSGGEGTVTLGKSVTGRGGRNTEFLLSLAITLDGADGIWAIAGDSDGIDGMDDAAGAIIGPDTLRAGPNAREYLANHDSHTYFDAVGALLRTGPTLTNVNDIRAILLSAKL